MPEIDTRQLIAAIESSGMNRSELAKRADVSRAQLHRLASRPKAAVRKKTLEKLANALHLDADKLSPGGTVTRFRRVVEEQHGRVDFRGMGMPRVEQRPIDEVFVDVSVREWQERAEDDAACFGERSPVGEMPRAPDRPMGATDRVRSHDRVVLIGNPGCGKTTILRYLAHTYAKRDERDAELPMYIRLPDYCRAKEIDERIDLVRFAAVCAAKAGCHDVEGDLRAELGDDRRRCLVLLDGLDEVGDEGERGRLTDCIRNFVEQFPRNHFVLTSRVVGFEATPWTALGFSVFRVLGYDGRQLKEFCEKWAKVLARSDDKQFDQGLRSLETAVFSNPRVRALAANPLMLTILVLLHEARGGTLPRRRVDLYAKVVDVFLDTWESAKRSEEQFDETRNIDLDAREFRWLLSDVALAMQKAERTVAARWWIVERMQDSLQQKLGFPPGQAKDACDRIVRYLSERTGLLEERGLDLFGFSHRTLQEYFAALGIIDESEASTARDLSAHLRGYLYHPLWSEVVRLAAAQVTPPLAESLLSNIIADPDPVGRFLRRGQLLALRCLADGSTVSNRPLIASLLDSIAELGKSKWLGITFEAIEALDGFEGTRLEQQAEATKARILDTAKDELATEDHEQLRRWVGRKELFEAADRALLSGFGSEAAREVVVNFEGQQRTVICLNLALLLEQPNAWYSSACSILEDPARSDSLKELLVRELGRRVTTDRRARLRLRKILVSAANTSLRTTAASALGAVATGKGSAKRLLLQVLERDRDERVRWACAEALKKAAVEEFGVRDRLVKLLIGNEPELVRAGAARGLTKLATKDQAVCGMLEQRLLSKDESLRVRVSCAWALAPLLGKNAPLVGTFKALLQEHQAARLQRVVAQALALAMADEQLDWDHHAVERIEEILMKLEDPCSHALESLEALATAREVRRGLRLENVMRDSLRPVADRIELAFVFGSTARNRQTEDSDVDLLIIGDVSLKLLSQPLRDAEKVLGRRINPALYSRESFRRKFQSGDPFLLDVYRREKMPIFGPSDQSTWRDIDDELRAMVAERMAATA